MHGVVARENDKERRQDGAPNELDMRRVAMEDCGEIAMRCASSFFGFLLRSLLRAFFGFAWTQALDVLSFDGP